MKARGGLTVLELLFGLTVVALVLSIGTATLSLLTGGRSSRSEVALLERDLAVRRTLVDWLEQAHASMGGTFQLVDGSRRGHGADVLFFTTTAPTPLGTVGTGVRLYVDADPTTAETGLTAELTSWPGGPTARVQLDSTIVGFDVRCLTNLLGGRRWVASWMSAAVMPRAVELTLRGSSQAPLSAILRMPIVVAVEGGR